MFASDLESFQRQFGDALASSAEDDVQVLDALAANYPILRALCGDEAFFGWAADFISRGAVREPRLNTFGDGFEAFLRNYEPARPLPYAPDVAAIERFVTEALFAADAEPLSADRLASRRRTGRAIVLHPATRFAQLTCPAVSIWLAHHDPRPNAFDAIEWSAEGVLVTRPGDRVEVRRIAAGALVLLRACADGRHPSDWADSPAGTDHTLLMAELLEAGAFA